MKISDFFLNNKDFWMKTWRTSFRYGLNERSKIKAPIVTIFYPVGKSGEINNRCHKNWNIRHSKISLRNF